MTARGTTEREAGRESFGHRIRALRVAAGISQETLADRAGIHRTYLSDLERGRRNVGLDNILAIATALEITASELLDGVQ